MGKFLNFSIITVLIIIIVGCMDPDEFEKDNPLDPNGPAFDPPKITWLSISDNQTIVSSDMTLSWTGNSTAVLFEYTLDGTVFSWTSSKSAECNSLDEGNHTFSIRTQNVTGYISSPLVVSFNVNAIAGPGIVLSPRKIISDGTVKLIFENVSSLMSAHIEVVCENNCGVFNGFTKRDSAAGSVQYIVYASGENTGRIILDIAFGSAPSGINGSVEIGSLGISPLSSGNIIIDVSTVRFKDTSNKDIAINGLDFVRVER